ncbi:Alpha/Beta hydrolase protein [Mycena belliarum]|uniref:acylaminoacyl-peptidase n=1 Tax=Mycena belliarum TaxID=1033014 RepID=A0AAD6U2D3_9AGAR|nr:Alpha/Beta hydrolase protein [Mycena belliae]
MSFYQTLSEIPLPTAAEFIGNDVLHVTSATRVNARDIKRTLTSSIFLGSDPASSSPAVDAGEMVVSVSAPADSECFPRRAVLRETAEKKRYVEIWIGTILEVSEDVSAAHGSFYSDEFFSGLAFAPSELAIMYVAEANEPKGSGEKFKFTPHIGEGLPGKKRPVIVLFRWDASVKPSHTSLATVAPALDAEHPILFGQPVFSPLDPRTIYATGYEYTRDGRLLGLRWCFNRPSGIWEIKLPEPAEKKDSSPTETSDGALRCPCTKLTPAHRSCRSPRIHHDARNGTARLFWLSCASGGPHGGTFSLHAADLTAQALPRTVLVDTVWAPRAADGFPGLYPDANLPPAPFVVLAGAVNLVFASVWGARATVLMVGAVDGRVTELTPDGDGRLYSWSVLATDGRDRVVCTRSAPTVPYEVVLGQLSSSAEVPWRVVSSPYISPHVRRALSRLAASVVPIPDRAHTQTVVLRPPRPRRGRPGSPPPCIQLLHGGPHGASLTAFSPGAAALALEGYTLSAPNYSGSTGAGEAFVRALLGNCGALDVQDCIATARHLVRLGLAVEGRGKQFVMGGSHGGYLAAHLIGQFPDMFTAAVIRNPVISTDPLSSDIPDWYFNEWAIDYPMASLPEGFRFPAHSEAPDARPPLPPRRTPDESKRVLPSSAMTRVADVTAHVLLHLGGADLRVTPAHGVEFFHALKGNARAGQGVEMQWFPEAGHSLDGVEVARVVWETSRDWFARYRI